MGWLVGCGLIVDRYHKWGVWIDNRYAGGQLLKKKGEPFFGCDITMLKTVLFRTVPKP
jgi:hypothetical protein